MIDSKNASLRIRLKGGEAGYRLFVTHACMRDAEPGPPAVISLRNDARYAAVLY